MTSKSPFFELAGHRIDILSTKDPHPFTLRCIPAFLFSIFIFILSSYLVFNAVMANYVHFTRGDQTILWLSDIHLDSLYQNHSNTSTWCHSNDSHSQIVFKFGRYGCDTPRALFDSLIENLPRLISPPTLIVIGGDNIGGVIRYSMYDVVQNFAFILQKLRSIFPKTPILPVLGNNEFVPNYGVWDNDTLNFPILSKAWEFILSPPERETLEQGGFYYRDFDHLRVLILNTVIYQVYRKEDDRTDPYGQFAWLEKVCAEARVLGLELFAFFHVPPSMSTRDRFRYQGWHQKYVNQFAAIFAKYKFAMTCGHLHIAAILPLFNNLERRDGYILSAPGLSLRHDSNPGFRLIKVRNGLPIDYDEYGSDIGENPPDVLKWKLAYSFNEMYGTHNLSHETLVELADRIVANSSLMWKYRKMMYQKQFFTRQFHRCLLHVVSKEELQECLGRTPDASGNIFHAPNHGAPSE